MGIAGLLPLLKDIQRETHVEAYRGKTLGVDAYVWLHRGAYACATDLALGRPTTKYVAYAMHRIKMLQHYGVTPYVVFDGGPLPSKAGTEAERAAKRRESRERGLALQAAHQPSAARDAFVRSVDVSPAMAHALVLQLRAHGIPYVVAPYEADAQLAYLEQEGLIDGIITEDSDLLVYGCRTVLFKLDTYGHCIEIQRERFHEAKQVALSGWSAAAFRRMAILSGCDYLPSIVGMGLKSAHRLVAKYETLELVLRALRAEGRMRVPPTYADEFARAEFTFAHQRVWDPRGDGRLTTLTPLPPDAPPALVACIGAPLSWDDARAIALGDVCPISRRRLGAAPLSSAAPQALASRGAQPTLASFFGRAGAAATPAVAASKGAAAVLENAGAPPAAAKPSEPLRPGPPAPVLRASPAGTTRADSSLSAADSLFELDGADVSPCTSPCTPPRSPSHAVRKTARASTSPSPPPLTSSPPQPAESEDVSVSSPVSSPTTSPPRPRSTPLRPARPYARRTSAPATPATPATPTLSWAAEPAHCSADDSARRAAWFQRFQFTGPRARHVGRTPPRAPSASPSARPAPAPRLPLGGRVVSAPAHASAAPPTPAVPPAPALGKRFSDTPAPCAETPRKRPSTSPATSAKLLAFQYRMP